MTAGAIPHFPTTTTPGFDPDPLLSTFRATEPVVRVQLPYGAPCWLLTRYDDVRSMLADPRFSRAATVGTDVGRLLDAFTIEDSILGMDPPQHTQIRRLVSATFTARRMEALRERAQQTVDILLDAMAGAPQPVDFVDAVALPLPITMICEILGVPFADRERFTGWANITLSASGHTLEEFLAARAELATYIGDLVTSRRAHPTDDVLGALVTLHSEDPACMTEAQLRSLAISILFAGFETTASQLGKFVLCLLVHPDQLALLRRQPELVPNAVEELMRLIPLNAGTQPAYLATEDVEIGGVTIRAGEGVMPSLGSANRDESEFPDAGRLDIERRNVAHLGFSHGAHFCLGAHLARVEMQVALRSLVTRFPELRLAVPTDQVPWKAGSAVWGLEALPLCF
jgi:nocardicin N-oxygenase